MDSKSFLRMNETYEDFYNRCNNISNFDCSEEEMLWWLMGSRRLPLTEIVPISVVLVVIFLTGVVGNVCVCVVIVRNPGLHTATNYYLFSLAVSDLLLLLFGLPNDLAVYWHQYPYSLGLVFCKLRAFISEAYSATYVSVLTISAFSLERYLAICHPLHLYAMAGLTRASRIVVVLWVVAFISASPFAVYSDISYREYPPNSGNISLDSAFCSLTASSPLLEISSIFFFFVPAILILCLYITMGIHIRYFELQISLNLHFTLMTSFVTLVEYITYKINGTGRIICAVFILVAVVIAFFVCWAPFHFQRLFFIYGYDHPQFNVINEHLFNVAGALYYVSATVNPILYNVMSARYRMAFHETLLCKHRPDRSNFDYTRRETTMSSTYRNRSSFYKEPMSQTTRISTSKVDYVKDESPFSIETKIDENTIFYFPNGTDHVQEANHNDCHNIP
ncbi:jg17347 [Pararge aegeria aegeria]|uniref:Jg17347 protein n=1 Tax=Pararge aegeria aegeria TaxID=348720 RepID=A0A8S4RQH4_9NEOP|nr:jg17347 [Pararge aegeria aegeria]